MFSQWVLKHGVTLLACLIAAVVGVVGYLLSQRQTGGADLPVPKVSQAPGWEIRYGATLALAQRGSQQTNQALLAEMLDEQKQALTWQVESKQSGKVIVQEQYAQMIVLQALEATSQLAQKQPLQPEVKQAVQTLRESKHPPTKQRADALHEQMQAK